MDGWNESNLDCATRRAVAHKGAMKPLVSIIINNFNYERYLEQAIRSALSQSWEAIEVVIVDDGSTDSSREIIERYKDRCTVILKPNGGQASALNAGLRAALGEYFLFLDSDDYLFPQAVETMVGRFPENYARVYCRPRLVDGDNKDIDADAGEVRRYYEEFDGDLFEHVRRGGSFFWSPTSTNLIRADVARAIGEIPEADFRISADAFLLVNASLFGPVKSVDAEGVAYRIHAKNNFVSRTFSYADAKWLANNIDDYYRRRVLFAHPCELKGVPNPTRPEWENVELIKRLCIGLRVGAQSPHLKRWNTLSLTGLIFRYMRRGPSGLRQRFVQATKLLSILILPKSLMLKLATRKGSA
jgi:glycosyltransferase involved in cell wall biosynthesis